MYIKQISIVIVNTPGRLHAVTRILREHNIDIRALSLSDTNDFGILRLIVADPDAACLVLKESGCTARQTDVLAIGLKDQPGGLDEAVGVLSENGINIEYLYAFVSRHQNTAYVLLRVEDNEKATAVLQAAGIQLIRPEDIYQM